MTETPSTATFQISDLILDNRNSRHHPPENLAAIKASLSAFGQQKPIIIDADMKVLAGNGTVVAATQLGLKTLVGIKTNLTGLAAIAYAIADNRTGELSEWDYQALALTLAQMTPQHIENSGFLNSSSENIQNLAKKIEKEHREAIQKTTCCPNCGCEQKNEA